MNSDDEASFPEMVSAPPQPPPEPPIPEPEPERDQVVVEEEDEVVMEPVKKEILNKKDIFISTPSSKKNVKVESGEEPAIVPIKKPRKKRVMTEEAKAKLAIARAKGMETRRRNAELRRQAKAEKEEEQSIIKAVRKKRLTKLKKELETPVDEVVVKKENKKVEFVEKVVEKVVPRGYSQEEMNKAISSALEANERARQVRKAEKKKKQAEEAHHKKIYTAVSKAVNPHDHWSFCFE